MNSIDLLNDFKHIEEVLSKYIRMKPVYKDGELYALKGEVFSISKSQDYAMYGSIKFEIDTALAVLSRVMPERYNIFGISYDNAVVIVSVDNIIDNVLKDVVDMYPIINEFDSNAGSLESISLYIRTMLTDDVDKSMVGISNDRFERLEKLVYQIDEMRCYTNTHELVEALRNRRISNENKDIDPGMLIFYSLFRNNKNIWMNFSCEGHVIGRVVDNKPIYELDESYVMLDFSDIFNETMDDIVMESLDAVRSRDKFSELFDDIENYGMTFKAMFSRAVSNKGWTYRVSIRFTSADTVTDSEMFDLMILNSKMLYCIHAVCEEINIRTTI